MAHTLALSTFLKLATIPLDQQIGQLSAYDEPGGYDYYRATKRAIRGNAHSDFAKASATIARIERDGEREDGAVVAEAVRKRFGRGPLVAPPRALWTSPKKVFSVRVEPEIAIPSATGLQTVAIYPTKSVPIRRASAGAAIRLMDDALNPVVSGPISCAVYDARRNRLYSSPTNTSDELLKTLTELLEWRLGRDNAA